MNRRLKVAALAAALAGFAAMAGTYDLGFERWPPQAVLADGASVALRPSEVQACFKTRVLRLFGDLGSEAYWQTCRQQLTAYGALGAFDTRSMIVAGSGLFGLMALFGFAMVSSNPPGRGAPPPRPLRAPPRLAIRRGGQDTSVRLL